MPHTELKWAIIIPARFNSSRFPGKPLIQILGKTLIQRVWERCVEATEHNKVYVATDDRRIAKHVAEFGGHTIMTSSSCLTGTDRVCEAAEQLKLTHAINVQGDEPLLNPTDIIRFVEMMYDQPQLIINGMTKIQTEDEFCSPTIPKVVTTPDGALLYMSRAAIPTTKQFQFVKASKQVCIYVFPIEQLKAFSERAEKTPLEEIEDIEVLRFLELGFNVQMVEVDHSSIAVDVPEDVKRVEAALTDAKK